MGSSPEIYIDPLLLMKRQKANSLDNITWSDLGKQNIQTKGLFPREGESAYERGGDAGRLA